MSKLKQYYVCWDEKKSGTLYRYYTIVIAENQNEVKELVRDRQNERRLKGLPHMSHIHTIRFSKALDTNRFFRDRELLKLTGTTLGKRLEERGYDAERIEKHDPYFTSLGYLVYVVDPESQYGYAVQVDPFTGESRHRGFGKGCFWTEWR